MEFSITLHHPNQRYNYSNLGKCILYPIEMLIAYTENFSYAQDRPFSQILSQITMGKQIVCRYTNKCIQIIRQMITGIDVHVHIDWYADRILYC